jgi:hypothetical protein
MRRPDGADLKRTWVEYVNWLEAELEVYKWDSLEAALNRIAELEACVQNLMDTGDARIKELESKLHNIREIYIGMEGTPKNLYPAEAYLMRIIKQMHEAALEAGDE